MLEGELARLGGRAGKNGIIMAVEMDGKGKPPFERDPVVEVYKKDVDRTLLRENLKLTVEQRFDKLMALQRFAEDLRRAPRTAAGKP